MLSLFLMLSLMISPYNAPMTVNAYSDLYSTIDSITKYNGSEDNPIANKAFELVDYTYTGMSVEGGLYLLALSLLPDCQVIQFIVSGAHFTAEMISTRGHLMPMRWGIIIQF